MDGDASHVPDFTLMAQPDFGSTFETKNGGLTPAMRLLTTDAGKLAGWLASLARRLAATPGALWYDPNYGFGLANLVADDEEPSVAAELINQCFKQDERCASCTTTIVVSANGSEWTITSNPVAQDGAVYELVFLASASKASLLTAKQGS